MLLHESSQARTGEIKGDDRKTRSSNRYSNPPSSTASLDDRQRAAGSITTAQREVTLYVVDVVAFVERLIVEFAVTSFGEGIHGR